MKCSSIKALFLIPFLTLHQGCGKFGPPLPPEALSPKSIRKLEVLPEATAVRFKWLAPLSDFRGKELKSMDGYWIYRKPILEETDLIDSEVPFELLATVADPHVAHLEELRERARVEGKLAHRVKLKEDELKFEYLDGTPKSGTTYVYKIVPFNQGSVAGGLAQLISVTFDGEKSKVDRIDAQDYEDEIIADLEDL